MTLDLEVRPVRRDDAPGLAELLNAVIGRGGTTALEEPFTPEALDRTYLTGPGVICCFAALDRASGRHEGFQTLVHDAALPAGHGDIGTFVRVDGAQRGVGGQLFTATRAEALRLGLAGLNATIRADNAGGLRFYARMGFREHGVRRAVPLKDGTPVDRISRRYVVDAPA